MKDEGTVREALRRYHAENGFAGDAMTAETIQVRLFGRVAELPNPRFQRALLARHDLHHVITGYGTDLRGEAELGAWELAAGPRHWLSPPPWAEPPRSSFGALRELASRARWMALGAFVWANNGAALMLGVLAPVRTLKAFVRGLGCRSLYRDEAGYEALLEMRVEELRARVGTRA
ncbi:MAG TPA: hypothetical protein VIL20_26175 [Sandaracinaceae bacterium]